MAAQAGLPGVISFFSGCGILDLGFESAGFRTYMANECNKAFVDAYEYGRDAMGAARPLRGVYHYGFDRFVEPGWARNVLMGTMEESREATGLVGFIGGPPCPDFSIAGKQAGEGGINGKLTQQYADLICVAQPDFFLMENVKGLWSTAKHRDFYRRVVKQLEAAGYVITAHILNALDYWVPQDRARVIVIGFRGRSFPRVNMAEVAAAFPWDTYRCDFDPKRLPWPTEVPFAADGEMEMPPDLPAHLTVEWWFRKNRVLDHPNAEHYFQPKGAAARFASILEGDTSRKSFKRLHRWRYSPTVAYGNNEVHLHPYKARRLSVAEAMAIQTLPRKFALPPKMSLSDMFKTVGNGVPYLFARSIAYSLADTLAEARA